MQGGAGLRAARSASGLRGESSPPRNRQGVERCLLTHFAPGGLLSLRADLDEEEANDQRTAPRHEGGDWLYPPDVIPRPSMTVPVTRPGRPLPSTWLTARGPAQDADAD